MNMLLQFLAENRIEFLKKQHAGGIDTSHDTFAVYHDPNEIIDYLSGHDPSPNKQYTQWMVGQYKKQNIRQEDAYRTGQILRLFHDHKHNLPEKDVNKYSTLADLHNAVHGFENKPATKREGKVKAIHEGLDVLHKDDKYQINRLKTREASQALYGGGARSGSYLGTDWCTATRGEWNMFHSYTGANGDLYTVHIHGDDSSPYQYHSPSGQFMNRYDEPVRKNRFFDEHPTVTKTLGKHVVEMADNPKDLQKHVDNYDGSYEQAKILKNHRQLTDSQYSQLIDKHINAETPLSVSGLTNLVDSPRINNTHIDKMFDALEASPIKKWWLAEGIGSIHHSALNQHVVDRALKQPNENRRQLLTKLVDVPNDRFQEEGGDVSTLYKYLPKQFVTDGLHNFIDHKRKAPVVPLTFSASLVSHIARHTPHREHIDHILDNLHHYGTFIRSNPHLNEDDINKMIDSGVVNSMSIVHHKNFSERNAMHIAKTKADDPSYAKKISLNHTEFTPPVIHEMLKNANNKDSLQYIVPHATSDSHVELAKRGIDRMLDSAQPEDIAVNNLIHKLTAEQRNEHDMPNFGYQTHPEVIKHAFTQIARRSQDGDQRNAAIANLTDPHELQHYLDGKSGNRMHILHALINPKTSGKQIHDVITKDPSMITTVPYATPANKGILDHRDVHKVLNKIQQHMTSDPETVHSYMRAFDTIENRARDAINTHTSGPSPANAVRNILHYKRMLFGT